MKIDYKELLFLDCKWIFLLAGFILGLVLGAILMNFNKDLKVAELDLKKIIRTYSEVSARSKKSMEEIQKEFRAKLNCAIAQVPAKTIVVNKGSLLSKHKIKDYTEQFMEIMEITKVDNQTSN